ncbi:MAG: long-chain fatty acid--CoA ligase [Myxococcota bacterium]
MDVTPLLEVRPAPRIVFEQAARRGDAPRFFIGGNADLESWTPVSWSAFAAQVRDVALFLRGELAPGDFACIFAPNRVEWIAAALGIQTAGAAMVPIYGSSTPEQAGYVVDHSGAKVVFVDSEVLVGRVLQSWASYAGVRRLVTLSDDLDVKAIAARLRAAGLPVPSDEDIEDRFVSFGALRARGAAVHAEEPGALGALLDAIDLEGNAVMLYTSGTSGRPKGVPLTHRNVGENGSDWLRCNGPLVEEGMVDLLWLPMSHIFGFGEACLGNQLGWTSYLCSPAAILELLPLVRPHVFMSVPSVWEKLATLAGGPGEALRALTGDRLSFCLSGGAGLKREVKELFHESGLLIIEGYGLTECSPTLTLNRLDDFRFDTVGKPLPSVELKLAEDGEILARGPNVFSGYHRNAEATAEAFDAEGWFRTGDIGRFTEDGFLQIVDRKKDILVTAGGKNVAPANIEIRFQHDPLVDHCVVYGDGRKYLVAGLWPSLEARAAHTGDALRAALAPSVERVNAELARFETIKKFAVFEEPLTIEGGFLTPTLKVKRKRVVERFGDRLAALYDGGSGPGR